MRIPSNAAPPPARAARGPAVEVAESSAVAHAGGRLAEQPAPQDVVELSPAAEGCTDCDEDDAESGIELSDEASVEVEELERRDAEVRRHEMAHAAAGGQYAGSPVYDFQTGPDGRRYAVGGHVNIDVGEVQGEPEKTIEKMRVVRAAALAPAEPSGQDRRVAAEAAKKEAAAHAELAEQRTDEAAPMEGDAESAPADDPTRGASADGRRDSGRDGGELGDGASGRASPASEARPVVARARGRLAWAAARREHAGPRAGALDLAA